MKTKGLIIIIVCVLLIAFTLGATGAVTLAKEESVVSTDRLPNLDLCDTFKFYTFSIA